MSTSCIDAPSASPASPAKRVATASATEAADREAGMMRATRPSICPPTSPRRTGAGNDAAPRVRPTALPSAFVLHRPIDLHAEFLRGVERPVRVAQQLPGGGHDVRLSGRDDLIRLRRVRDEADGRAHHAGLPSYAFGKRRLI